MRLSVGLTLLLLLVCSCKSKETSLQEKEYSGLEPLYNDALVNTKQEKYKDAAILFERVDAEYPFSTWAAKSKLMAAYNHYLLKDYDAAASLTDEFIKLYPNNSYAPYAYYLKGMCYYNRIPLVARDQEMTTNAKDTFQDLLAKFLDTDYSRDAKMKLSLIDDHLAGKEMYLGRYYLFRGDTAAAINLFQGVVDFYENTPQIEEALYRLVESYYNLGLTDEARKHYNVLAQNYNQSDWTKRAEEVIAGLHDGKEETGFKAIKQELSETLF
jgi:outer membrane protein assembly factor BamD